MARFIEEWSSRTNTSLDDINAKLDAVPQTEVILEHFGRIETRDTFLKDQQDRIESKLDLLLPSGNSVTLQPQPTLGEDTSYYLNRSLMDASATVIQWDRTVGVLKQHITTAAEKQAIEALDAPSDTILILGAKGSGKSALSGAVCVEAIRRGFAILAIRADKIPAEVTNAEQLRQHLQLPVSPNAALRLLAAKQKALLVVDQLDSVSELIDRRSERLNLLLNLIKDVSGDKNIHVLAACREFDYQHDSRLSTINATEVRLPPVAWAVVEPLLDAEGYKSDTISKSMRELLCVPWNLNMFLRVAKPEEAFGSMQSLIEAVWRKSVTNPSGPLSRTSLVDAVADRMSKREELFVPAVLADDTPEARDALLHDEILVSEANGRRLAFRHQTYYDYALARLFASGTKRLSEHVLALQDGLFVRPAMLNGLELLRESSRSDYHREVRAIIDANPRQHIRRLLIEYIAQQRVPDDREIQIILSLISGSDGPLIFRASAGSVVWFDQFRQSGELSLWMKRSAPEAVLCINLLVSVLAERTDVVLDLVRSYWTTDHSYDHLVLGIARNLTAWNKDWERVAAAAVRRSPLTVDWLTKEAVSDHPEIATELIRAQLDRELEQAIQDTKSASPEEPATGLMKYARRQGPVNKLISDTDYRRASLEEVAKEAPRHFLEAVWPWFLKVLEQLADHPHYPTSYIEDDSTWGGYEMSPLPMIQALHAAADEWASASPHDFVKFAKQASGTGFLAAHRVLAQALAVAASAVPNAGLDYLIADPRRLVIGTFSNHHKFSEALIAAVSGHLAAAESLELQNVIMDFDMYPPSYRAEGTPEQRFRYQQWNRQSRLRLLRSFPEHLLSEQARSLKGVEESMFPNLRSYDSAYSEMSFIGPRMTAEELGKASNDQITGLFDELNKHGDEFGSHRRGLPSARSGGVRQQAGEFGKFSEQNVDRAKAIVERLDPARRDHQGYTAAAISGIARSTIGAADVFGLIAEMYERGFNSDDCREAMSGAVDLRAKAGQLAPEKLIATLEGWLESTKTPVWPTDHGAVERNKHRHAMIFRHGGMLFTLMHGRAEIFRVLSEVYEAFDPPDISRHLRTVRSRVGKEDHPKVCAEMLRYSYAPFRNKGYIPEATALFDQHFHALPETLLQDATIHTLGDLTGHFLPEETYEGWLSALAEGDDPAKQAYGELLFLYYARRTTDWADLKISEALGTPDLSVMFGMTYGAFEAFEMAHCRRRATDILCAAVQIDDSTLREVVRGAITVSHDNTFTLDEYAVRLIQTICRIPEALILLGAQLLESVSLSAGTHPALVYRIAQSVLDVAGPDASRVPQSLSMAAGILTSIAITLHRQPDYRVQGLQLFETLQERGFQEAAAALDLLDRKPYQQYHLPNYFRRFRRRRKAPAS